jgi:hypothetical protein
VFTSAVKSAVKLGARAVLPRRAYELLRLHAFRRSCGRLAPAYPEVTAAVGAGGELAAQIGSVNANAPTALCWIMRTAGSDKGLAEHNYTTVYSALFGPVRHSSVRVFELGIGTNNPSLPSTMGVRGVPGASLRGWARYFPNGRVYGADIDRAILFRESRIETFYCDQRDPEAIAAMWEGEEALRHPFDVLVEDGLHTFEANATFLEHSLDKVAPLGYYVAEDVRLSDFPRWRERIGGEYARRFPDFDFALVRVPWAYGASADQNNLLVARRRRHT